MLRSVRWLVRHASTLLTLLYFVGLFLVPIFLSGGAEKRALLICGILAILAGVAIPRIDRRERVLAILIGIAFLHIGGWIGLNLLPESVRSWFRGDLGIPPQTGQ